MLFYKKNFPCNEIIDSERKKGGAGNSKNNKNKETRKNKKEKYNKKAEQVL